VGDKIYKHIDSKISPEHIKNSQRLTVKIETGQVENWQNTQRNISKTTIETSAHPCLLQHYSQ
jgi:hypothetical protein